MFVHMLLHRLIHNFPQVEASSEPMSSSNYLPQTGPIPSTPGKRPSHGDFSASTPRTGSRTDKRPRHEKSNAPSPADEAFGRLVVKREEPIFVGVSQGSFLASVEEVDEVGIPEPKTIPVKEERKPNAAGKAKVKPGSFQTRKSARLRA